MRKAMLDMDGLGREIAERNELPPPVAMFAVGGMEGIRDEAAMFLQATTKRPCSCSRRRAQPQPA